ncbi:glucocorticoid receptor-like (DNA-binding domain) [Basidiobolus meristosporus CBS 931.73]|uniref:Glucocorticoid receptor-like (DNA-binding domain) n=1 Tax=Basidiobolus meristosporus CBS 931.73 TaxID=1314790 RepID=A0A1Y1YL61_9FUNG|nr:glucocorticoid receptor-like (DNA-binding domain) [Basidiobolus meristosporus CBS 931.73]|eukprot:ORX98324.1 glucocorticoid receptor-like (DNA-binding domain) [Basidiobolus meristosporus CBS 931.73]
MPQGRILRDMQARVCMAKNELTRQAYRYIVRNETYPTRVRMQAQLALNNFPRAARSVNIKNRCLETGRGRGVFRDFRLCRFEFRLQALRGQLPGVIKSTW